MAVAKIGRVSENFRGTPANSAVARRRGPGPPTQSPCNPRFSSWPVQQRGQVRKNGRFRAAASSSVRKTGRDHRENRARSQPSVRFRRSPTASFRSFCERRRRPSRSVPDSSRRQGWESSFSRNPGRPERKKSALHRNFDRFHAENRSKFRTMADFLAEIGFLSESLSIKSRCQGFTPRPRRRKGHASSDMPSHIVANDPFTSLAPLQGANQGGVRSTQGSGRSGTRSLHPGLSSSGL